MKVKDFFEIACIRWKLFEKDEEKRVAWELSTNEGREALAKAMVNPIRRVIEIKAMNNVTDRYSCDN